MKDDKLITQTHPLITPEHLRRLAIIYVRQSSERQVLEHTGSADFQRNLTAVARSYGWLDAQILIIDEDLGLSGSSTELRTGLQRLQAMIGAKQVGAVFVANISRLSRQLIDFEVLRIIAAANRTLIYTDGRFVDPADSNDIVFSQLNAMLAAHENRQRVRVMSQARLTKAQQGKVVSSLPVGWVERPDGGYDFDPETKDTIQLVIETFRQTRSVYRTVRALIEAEVQIPSRQGRRLFYTRPNAGRIIRILTNPVYAGVYAYGKTQSQAGGPLLANGHSKRVRVAEEAWIKNYNHHPAYLSVDEQEEFKSILKKNGFGYRHRAGRGPALMQGLLRCATCKRSLSVGYHRQSHCYACRWGEACTQFTNAEFDERVLAEVFKILQAPPLEMLTAALEETRNQERVRHNWIRSERERIQHEKRKAQALVDRSYGRHPRAYDHAVEKFDAILKEEEEFEQKIAVNPGAPKNDATEQELEELCRLATEVPGLWHHPAVTYQERKEILRAVIDHVVVAATKERIDATVVWKTGAPTSFFLWCGIGRYNLIRELHGQNLTAPEIQEHLAAGKTSTGQVVKICLTHLYNVLQKLELKPNHFSSSYVSLRQSLTEEAAELVREGRTLKWIAQYFNEQGFASPRGTPWTRRMVWDLTSKLDEKLPTLGDIHRNAIMNARARGLNYDGMAREFNEKGIPRKSDARRHWTARMVGQTCRRLNLIHRDSDTEEANGIREISTPDL